MVFAADIDAIPFRRLIWLLPTTFTLHELEEWNILGWYRQQFTNPPDTPDFAVRALLVLFSLLAFLWTAVGVVLPTPRATAYFVLPFFVPFVLANNLQHIYWQVAFAAYAPGVLASAFLNIPAILLLSWHARRSRLVGCPYVVSLYVLSLAPVIAAARTGRTVPATMHRVHEFGAWFGEVLLGAV